MSTKARRRSVRRDRRKAKQSGFRRLVKKMSVVGHGSAATVSVVDVKGRRVRVRVQKRNVRAYRVRAHEPLVDLATFWPSPPSY